MPVLAAVLAMLALAPSPPAEARASVDFHHHRLSNSTLVWRRPVSGAVARRFAYGANPFRAGWHRGVDLAAPPGSPVRAACSGVVVTARPGVATLRCGPWRVTHLPLASHAVAVGDAVRAGSVVGTVSVGGEHRGLHLGVRRESDRFAYVDPLPFFAGRTSAPPTVGPPRTTRVPRSGPSGARPVVPPAPPPVSAGDRAIDRRVPQPGVVQLDARGASGRSALDALRGLPPATAPVSPPAAVPASPPGPLHGAPTPPVRVSSPAGAGGLAPWPAWVGLALLALGAVGGGVRVRVRRGRARVSSPVPSAR
jgi:hypothetical protein